MMMLVGLLMSEREEVLMKMTTFSPSAPPCLKIIEN
jgi:hypothetical protein